MNPNQSVPDTVARGFAAPLPGVPFSALISTARTMISATIQNTTPDRGTPSVRWLAAAMKKSMGTDIATLVREASPAFAPAGPLVVSLGRDGHVPGRVALLAHAR